MRKLAHSLVIFAMGLMLSVPISAQSSTESVYKGQCANCHAANGSGDTAAGRKMRVGDLRAEHVQKQQDAELFKSIAHGTGHKQYPHAFAHRGLTEKQIQDLVTYIRELPKMK